MLFPPHPPARHLSGTYTCSEGGLEESSNLFSFFFRGLLLTVDVLTAGATFAAMVTTVAPRSALTVKRVVEDGKIVVLQRKLQLSIGKKKEGKKEKRKIAT